MALSFKDYDGQTVTVQDVSDDLDSVKMQKIKELSVACQNAIIYGFVATNGNGYRLTIEDQLNMQGQKAKLDSDTTITSVDWITIDDKLINHTRDEWLVVYDEAFNHKNNSIFKNKSLRDKVYTCATVDEVKLRL